MPTRARVSRRRSQSSPRRSIKEKRHDVRVLLEMRVDYQCNENFLFEYSMNLSQNGIFIRTDKPLPPGTELVLNFNLPDTKELIQVKGEVIWINTKRSDPDADRSAGMGIRFLNIADGDRREIMSLVKRLAIL